jgi:hypothetical protein
MEFWSLGIISLLSIGVELGGLIYAIFFSSDLKKKGILTAVLSVLLIFTAGIGIEYRSHKHRVEEVSNEIIKKIGKETMTLDQLYQQLFNPDYSIYNEALGNLVEKGKLGYQIIQVYNRAGDVFLVRGFYLNLGAGGSLN